MLARRMGVAVVALCALFVSAWGLPDAAASEGAREPARPLAEMAVGASQVDWQPAGDYEHLTLTVAGPGGLRFRQEFAAGQPASFSLFDQNGQHLPDGAYAYELRLVPRKVGNLPKQALLQAGSFAIRNGHFAEIFEERKDPGDAEPVTEAEIQNITAATEVIPEDLVVEGKACIGPLCDAVGFPVLKLRNDAGVGILFDAVEGPFYYGRNWLLQANPDPFAGGLQHFFLQDLDAGTIPFSVQGEAPDYSLVVGGNSVVGSTGGNIGVGTALPAKAVHVARTDTPTLRFEDTYTGTFPGIRTWDVGASSTELFVKDVTNSSSIPFRIQAGAPTDSLRVSSTGQIGIGTGTPAASLHVNAGEVRLPPGAGSGGFTHFNYVGDGKNYIRGTTVMADIGGNVGIGIGNPSVPLHVAANSGQPTARLQNNNAAGYPGIEYLDHTGNVGLFFGLDNAASTTRLNSINNKPIVLLTNSTERMRVTSAGNVGIGTSSPGTKLHLFDDAADVFTILTIQNTGSGVNSASTFRAQSNTAFMQLQAHGSGRTLSRFGQTLGGWSELIQSTGNGLIIGTGFDKPLILGTNSTNRLQIDGSTGAVTVSGNLTVTGVKNFAVADPADTRQALYYTALEGPEAGTYFRGTAKTSQGEAVIELPGYFARLTEPERLTVQLTPLGSWGQLYVAEKTPSRLVVRVPPGSADLEFDYLVQGVRKGYLDYQVQRPNTLPQ